MHRCINEIRIIDVNQHTLELFAAPDKATLLRSLPTVMRDEMEPCFREQLIDLWDGKLFQQREVVNYALDGNKLNLLLQFSVFPGREHDWSLVQVALTDITARKKAEAYLEYLGSHDALTKLCNRSFFAEELNRLERRGTWPVTIIMIDLNGLKAANDERGHAAGDALLRRAGEVLNSIVDQPARAARIGGDEFAVILPNVESAEGEAMMKVIFDLVVINNGFYTDLPLSLSMGLATSQRGERLEAAVKRADLAMLEAKREHYTRGVRSATARDGVGAPRVSRFSFDYRACRQAVARLTGAAVENGRVRSAPAAVRKSVREPKVPVYGSARAPERAKCLPVDQRSPGR